MFLKYFFYGGEGTIVLFSFFMDELFSKVDPAGRKNVTVRVLVQAPLKDVWEAWTKPEHITKWYFASDDWEAPRAENDVRVGGKFVTAMAARDKSAGFDFEGMYTKVQVHELLEYDIADGRHVRVEFVQSPEGIILTETFEMEQVNSEELQRAGWQAILNNFKKYTERLA